MVISKTKIYLTFFVSILITFIAEAQITQDGLSGNLTGIKSIDISDDDFSGYEILAQKIGDARIVMLGEQTHGHGTTFTAKSKIIKYLVENMGFDVVAFESSFYEMNKLWDSDIEFVEKLDSTKREIYGIWSDREETIPFFNYVKERNINGKRLDLTGFDCKHEMPYGQKNYVNDLHTFLLRNQLKIINDNEYPKFKTILQTLVKLKDDFKDDITSIPNPDDFRLFNRFLDSIPSQLIRLPHSYETEFWGQEVKSLKKEARSCWILSKSIGISRLVARDSAMAENLLWLASTKFKGRKIIVWAASFHIAKNKEKFETSKYFNVADLETMGNILDKSLPKQVYSLGFISSEGSYMEWYRKKHPVYPIKRSPSSFETLVAIAPYDYAFIDMRSLANEKSLNMAGIGEYETKAVWNSIFDGVFYIRKMGPPTYTKK